MTLTAAGPPPPPATRLPTEDDLPYTDGIPIDSQRHVLQLDLLRHSLDLHWSERRDYFVVLDVEHRARKSWVVWQEGKGPDVVIEFLSETTTEIDRTVKKQVYQDEVRVPEYFWYDLETGELAGFALREGGYEPILPDEAGRLPSRRLGLTLAE